MFSFLSFLCNTLSHMIDCFRQHAISLTTLCRNDLGLHRGASLFSPFSILLHPFQWLVSPSCLLLNPRLKYLTACLSLGCAFLCILVLPPICVFPYCYRSRHSHYMVSQITPTTTCHLFPQSSLVGSLSEFLQTCSHLPLGSPAIRCFHTPIQECKCTRKRSKLVSSVTCI